LLVVKLGMLRKIGNFVQLVLPLILVFVCTLRPPYYLDLGWHLKYGEYFFNTHKVLQTNPYSSTMQNYQWANGSWGIDLITYLLYNHWGFWGLTIAGSITITLTFYFFSKALRLNFFKQAIIFPILLYLESPVNYFSFRGHQLSYLFLGILVYLFSLFPGKRNNFIQFFLIPLLFLFWANLHRASIFGLILYGLMIGFFLFKNIFKLKKKKYIVQVKILALSFVLSCMATLINPFGIQVHIEALKHFNNPLLKELTEYIPLEPFTTTWVSHVLLFSGLVVLTIYWIYKRKILEKLPIVGIPLILLLIGFQNRRYVWESYYMALPFLAYLVVIAEQRIGKYRKLLSSLFIGATFSLVIFINFPYSFLTKMSWENYCKVQNYPCSSRAAEYLSTHKINGKLFTFYDWGGWIIWNYPTIKPSVDGRMTLWKDEDGFSAFKDYVNFTNGSKKIDKSEFDAVFIPLSGSPLYLELDQLLKDGKWKLIYEDDVSAIVVREP